LSERIERGSPQWAVSDLAGSTNTQRCLQS
jgi:hypothetical protein